MMVTGTNLVLTMLYKCRVIFITMVTVTNLVLKLDQNLELLSYLDSDGHWNQFGTTDYHAKETYRVIFIMMVTRTNLVPQTTML